ncbi:unnamed protein product [Clonostachys rosea f. rosea IK726]|uniref:Endonuclease/exonuclease/phosphatase domain-containing protein n=2 Tax=Bionectria ochroleuca TaxID=29856 RepID=A0A0B7KN79_BIOOC|nr:unnamed protein product [Clonostachys rosea f. rosea IK726]
MAHRFWDNLPTSFPWRRGSPFQQPYHVFSESDQTWHPVKPTWRRSATSDPYISSFTVLSWNIDFVRILPGERMRAALDHLRPHVNGNVSSEHEPDIDHKIIMLNEMTDSDLQIIQSQDWIQQEFQLTDISSEYWESDVYGTCMLVPKSMAITDVFRVHYTQTNMSRDALFVEVYLRGKKVRLCTTHLESLVARPPLRPRQLAEAARHLHNADAGILGGDLNAIERFDRNLHTLNNLKDAYLETGQEEGSEAGMTWGQMAATSSRNRHGLTRMDKILYCGDIQLQGFETFGTDVQVTDEVDRQLLIEEEGLEEGWATDHLGVKAKFLLVP